MERGAIVKSVAAERAKGEGVRQPGRLLGVYPFGQCTGNSRPILGRGTEVMVLQNCDPWRKRRFQRYRRNPHRAETPAISDENARFDPRARRLLKRGIPRERQPRKSPPTGYHLTSSAETRPQLSGRFGNSHLPICTELPSTWNRNCHHR